MSSAFGNLSRVKPHKEDDNSPQQVVRPLKWQIPSFDDQYGKNIAIVGQPMVGKTNLAMLLGYFNSEYKSQMKEKGYERVIQVMDAGLLPEIEKIMVLESENNLLKALTAGVEKALFRPFIQKGIIEIVVTGLGYFYIPICMVFEGSLPFRLIFGFNRQPTVPAVLAQE